MAGKRIVPVEEMEAKLRACAGERSNPDTFIIARTDAIATDGLDEFHGETDIFIRPGYPFQVVDAMITNFHLPRSTLLALVMAFAGTDLTRRAYERAIAERFRFYSYGDAMLIRGRAR